MSDDRPNLREVKLDIADDKTRACADTIGVLEGGWEPEDR